MLGRARIPNSTFIIPNSSNAAFPPPARYPYARRSMAADVADAVAPRGSSVNVEPTPPRASLRGLSAARTSVKMKRSTGGGPVRVHGVTTVGARRFVGADPSGGRFALLPHQNVHPRQEGASGVPGRLTENSARAGQASARAQTKGWGSTSSLVRQCWCVRFSRRGTNTGTIRRRQALMPTQNRRIPG